MKEHSKISMISLQLMQKKLGRVRVKLSEKDILIESLQEASKARVRG